MISRKECEKALHETLGKGRRQHSLCVAEQAVRLARRYGADPERAEIAGLLHDVAKEFPFAEKQRLVQEFGVYLDDVTRRLPTLWHAVLGAAYAKRRLGVQEPDILSAIRYHTTGRAGMTLLEKVVYIADYTSADRTYPDADNMRRIVEADLDAALREALRYTLLKQIEGRLPVHPDSLAAYNERIVSDPPPSLRLD